MQKERRIKNEVDVNFQILGVVTTWREYKFCFTLNQILQTDFRKVNDLVFDPGDRTPKIQFGVLKAGEEDDPVQYLVFNNKNGSEVLLSEYADFDFIIRINGKRDSKKVKQLMQDLKSFPEIVMVVEIPVKKLKKPERLTYEEEKPIRKPFRNKSLH